MGRMMNAEMCVTVLYIFKTASWLSSTKCCPSLLGNEIKGYLRRSVENEAYLGATFVLKFMHTRDTERLM